MDDTNASAQFELIYIIVNKGMGSRVLQTGKGLGLSGGIILLGKGTIKHSILNFLSLYEEQKEVILSVAQSGKINKILSNLNEIFHFEKPNHGIVFTTNVGRIVGSRLNQNEGIQKEREVSKSMYQLIITIVNRGNASDVIEAAEKAGSKGGTIINARGSGIHEVLKIFNMIIEPEKEMVLILSKHDVTDAIVSAIQVDLEIDKPGNGIIFIQDVNQTYGIYK